MGGDSAHQDPPWCLSHQEAPALTQTIPDEVSCFASPPAPARLSYFHASLLSCSDVLLFVGLGGWVGGSGTTSILCRTVHAVCY